MPDPDVVRLMREFKASLHQREADQMRVMAQRWMKAETALQDRFLELSTWMARQEGPMPIERIMQQERYQLLAAKASEQVGQYNRWAEGNINEWRHEAVKDSIAHSAQALKLIANEAGESVSFSLLNTSSVDAMIAFTQPKTPLSELLSQAFPDSMSAVADAMVTNVALGKGPKALAKILTESFGMGLNRSLLIARTEQLRASRESSRLEYQNSGLVGGYQRIAFHNKRTCPACLMAEGDFYPIEDYFIEHPQGRCILMPVLKGHGPYNFKTGQQWFMEQSPQVQKEILGTGRYDLWKEGQFELRDLVRKRENATWGASMRTATLKELTAGKRTFAVTAKSTPLASRSSYSGMSLPDLEKAWYDLHDDVTLSPAEKAELAKRLRKAVREKGGSVTSFTGRAPAGPVLNRDWYKYRHLTMDELEQQWYLLKADTTLQASEREFLIKELRKTVRSKGGSVTNFTSGINKPAPAPRPEPRVPKDKTPKVTTEADLLRARKYELAQYYPPEMRALVEDYADLEAKLANGKITKAEHFKQFNLLNKKFRKKFMYTDHRLPRVMMTKEEAAAFKFESKTVFEMKSELKNRLRLELDTDIADSTLIQNHPKLKHLFDDLEESVRDLEGVMPGHFHSMKIHYTLRDIAPAIADADMQTGTINIYLHENTWGNLSAARQMVRSNWTMHENSVLHEIGHMFHFDTLTNSHFMRTTPGIGLSPSRYGGTDHFEYVAELFTSIWKGLQPSQRQWDYYQSVDGNPILKYFAESVAKGKP